MSDNPGPIGRPWARTRSRRLLLQALYQWGMTYQAANIIETQYLLDNDKNKFDTQYFHELLNEIINQVDELYEKITPVLDRSINDLDPIERAILSIGCYELIHRIDIPYRVVINEGVELAKMFGATDSHRYINGVLDKLAVEFRAVELSEKSKKQNV